jgi:phage terminase small subunit
MAKLTPKRERFCREYLIDLNAKNAAIRAGYSPKSAQEEGSRLLSDVKVMELLAKLGLKQADRLDLKADKVLRAIEQIAYSDVRGMFDGTSLKAPHEWDDDTAAAVAGMDIVTKNLGEGEIEYVAKIKRSDRLKALDMLARHHSLYHDKLEVEVTGNIAERLARAKSAVRVAATPHDGGEEE